MEDAQEIQRQLESSELKFRKLFETAQDGILMIDPLTEKITDANPYLLNLLQYSPGEVIGKKLWEIGVFKDIAESKMAFEKLQKEKYVRYENLPLQRKDGTSINVEFVSNVYPVDGSFTIQCNIRNITDRKIAEKKNLEGLEKMNTFMVGRELKMIELKKEIADLKEKLASLG